MRHATISCPWLPATALAITAALALPGCPDTTCTDIGWNEGLTVDLVSDDGYSEGSYEVVAIADGVTLRSRFAIENGEPVCADGCALIADGDSRGLTGQLELQRVDTSNIELASLNLYRVDAGELAGGPARAELSVRWQGAVLASAVLEPNYDRDELAGDGCGVATRATATVAVPATTSLCPSPRPVDGERCDLPADLRCEGAEEITTCSDRHGGTRPCACEDGVWSCPNIFCPGWCPATLEEAEAGAACDDSTENGACYYEDAAGNNRLCSCSLGAMRC